MTTKGFATELRDLIRSIRDKQGIAEIKCDNLIAYLEEVINSPEEEVSAIQMEKYKAELQLLIKQNEAVQASTLERFRTVILTGQNALKTAFLMNGGATVALLAFLGKLSDRYPDKISAFASCMVVFVMGVLAISMASGFTYLSSGFYEGSKSWQQKTAFWLNIFTIALGLSSYFFFIWGTIRAYKAFMGFP
jgi:hypothetical protein